MEHDFNILMIFGIMYNFEPYNVLLAIATNITLPVLLMSISEFYFLV